MSKNSKIQLSHSQYYQFRRWLDQLGEAESLKHSTAELATKASADLGFAVAASTVHNALKELGWNKNAPRVATPEAVEALVRRVTELEERVRRLDKLVLDL